MSNHTDLISQQCHITPEAAGLSENGPEPYVTPSAGATRRQFMKVGGSTLATLVTWNGLVETSKAVDQSSAALEYLIKGDPSGHPAGGSFNSVDHAIPGAAATLRIKTWCTPDPESHTNMKMECAGEIFGYGKVATTGRASLTATKEYGGSVFTSVGNTDPDPESAYASASNLNGFNYTLQVIMVTSRTEDDSSTNIKLRCVCEATVMRQNISTGAISTFSITETQTIEDYIIQRYPN